MTIGPQKQPFFSIHNPHCHDHVAAEWAAFDAYREFSVWPRHYQPMPGRPNGIDFDMDDMPITTCERGKPWVPAPGTTARFWVSMDGGNIVRLKLRRGQYVTHTEGGETDEGWDYTCRSWEFPDDEDLVTVSWVNNASDCDGPLTQTGTSKCLLSNLAAGYRCDDVGVVFPRWHENRYEQRDAYAEAAGY